MQSLFFLFFDASFSFFMSIVTTKESHTITRDRIENEKTFNVNTFGLLEQCKLNSIYSYRICSITLTVLSFYLEKKLLLPIFIQSSKL